MRVNKAEGAKRREDNGGTHQFCEREHHAQPIQRDSLRNIKATRVYTNFKTAEGRQLDVAKDVERIQRVIAGDVDFLPVAERHKMEAAVLRQKNVILQRSNGHPSNEPNASLRFSVESNGLSVEFKLGMSEAEYIDRLDDMLIRLDVTHVPSAQVLAMRSEFRALETLAERSAWLDALGTQPADNLKVRTAIVSLLQDRGFSDYGTLSLANRLSDQDARALLANLISLPRGLHGQELLSHAAFASIAQRAGAEAAIKEDTRKMAGDDSYQIDIGV